MAFRRARPDNDDQLELFTPTGKTHENTHSIRPDGRETLAGVPAEPGRGTRGTRGIAGDALRSSGENQGRDGRSADAIDEAGPDAATGERSGLGNGQGTLSPAATRSSQVEPPRNLANYRIAETDRLGEGSPKQKFRQNIEAIRLFRRIAQEKRAASNEDKGILVKYAGWGGLPQAFDSGNREWHIQHEELGELLTEEEYRCARASTLNAHYTAPVIIQAMYAALKRFGFSQGRILEPACGTGHFIGLMPDEMHRHSFITGVEIDPLTARIARALYPDADVRHSPYEETRLAGGYSTRSSFHRCVELSDELRVSTPSVFAAQSMPGMSNRYAFVSTAQIVSRLRDAGWVPVSAQQQRIKLEERHGFQRQLIRFLRRDVVPVKGEYTTELCLFNSHDRSSAYQLHAWLYRFIFGNGLFVSDCAFKGVMIRRTGVIHIPSCRFLLCSARLRPRLWLLRAISCRQPKSD